MRRIITIIFILVALAAVVLTVADAKNPITPVVQIGAGVLLLLVIADRVFGLFKPDRSGRIPPSQIAEVERLYFRCVREMLSDHPNLVQVISDLQRILSIDSNYKNARHYLARAIIMNTQGQGANPSRVLNRNSADFRRLQEQLIDPDTTVRKSVVMELIQYGQDAIDPLIALLMDDDSDVRVHAATALGWIGGRDAIQPLLVALQDKNQYVRRYAARALCWVIDDSAIEGLIAGLKDEDNYVRRYTARALGWSQDRRAIRPLVELLNTEENSDVRDYIYTALDDLGEPHPKVAMQVEAVSQA